MRRVAHLRSLFLIALCCAFGAVARVPAAHTPRPDLPLGLSGGSASPFAIADFDGDRKPDLATVEVEHAGARLTEYLIRFRLASGAIQSFGLSAAFGGLQIVPRDVNGDHAIDLVVSTAGLQQPVAVLLNDGHGKFTAANPASFAFRMERASSQWTPFGPGVHDGFALGTDGPSLATPAQEKLLSGPRDSRQALVETNVFVTASSHPQSLFGRAPPQSL